MNAHATIFLPVADAEPDIRLSPLATEIFADLRGHFNVGGACPDMIRDWLGAEYSEIDDALGDLAGARLITWRAHAVSTRNYNTPSFRLRPDILRLAEQGLSDGTIGHRLNISPSSVRRVRYGANAK